MIVTLLSLIAIGILVSLVAQRYDRRKQAIQKHIENGDIDMSLNIDSSEEYKDYIFSLDLGKGKHRVVVVNEKSYNDAKDHIANKYQITHDSILNVV